MIGCAVDRLHLVRSEGYRVDGHALRAALTRGYDLVVIVNPNSPAGTHIPRSELEPSLATAPQRTRFWIDETYIEYAGPTESLERFAARRENVVIFKSMSKMYALSGARAAYLCAAPRVIDELRSITPPWSVSLPAQICAVTALADPDYYASRYLETHRLRAQLAIDLIVALPGIEIIRGVANFLLCHLPAAGPDAPTVVQRCRTDGLYLRDAAAMGTELGPRALRIAVKDAQTNRRMVEILKNHITAASPAASSRTAPARRSSFG